MSSTEGAPQPAKKKVLSAEEIAKLKALRAEAQSAKSDMGDLKAYVLAMEEQFKDQSNQLMAAVRQSQREPSTE